MKKALSLLTLMLLVCIGAWAQTPADGIYKIVCPNAESSYSQRGAIAYKAGNDTYVYLAEVGNMASDYTNATGKSTTTDGVCGYWGIKTYEGKTWFYNLANGKTVAKPANADGATTWADINAENNVTIEASTAKSGQFWIKGNYNGAYLSISAWWGTQSTGGVRWYNKSDDNGCNLNITAVEASLATTLAATYADNIEAAEEKMGIVKEISTDPIKALSELSNKCTYTITSFARGQWTAVAGKANIYQTKGTEGSDWSKASGDYTPIDTNAEDANQQWAILKSENGNYYLYNVGQKKFFVSQSNYTTSYAKATLADEPNSVGFVMVDRADNFAGDALANYNNSDQSVRWALGMNTNDTDYFFGVTNWTGQSWQVFQNNTDYNKNTDKGMYFKVVPVESFDPTDALAKIKVFETVPTEYSVFSGGVPAGVVIKINGTVIEPEESWTVGATYSTITEVTKADITVENCGDGNVYDITVDNLNHQININFTQLFEPIASLSDKAQAKSYYIKNAQSYYPRLDAAGNLLGTNNRKEADKFIFINGAEAGKYYIYDLTAEKFVYATSTGDGTPSTTQTGSKVQLTEDQATAKCWTFDTQVCITPEQGGASGWNFCGGSVGYVLSLWKNTDGNSKWTIVDATIGSLDCAVTMFSEPGKEYMHKLVTENGANVQSIELLDELANSDLVLKEERAAVGNQYKYVWGHAPETEGIYYYNVVLSDNTKAKVSLTVSNFLQAPTPGMVWVSWNWFKNTIDHKNLTETAQGLVDKGLKEVGFNTIVIDDAWGTGTKNNNSTLTYNTTKFPDMKAFVEGVNAKGVKVGIYSDAAGATCGGYQPGSLGCEKQHVQMFDEWGIDFLKYDFCGGSNAFKSYKAMGDAIAELNATRKTTGEVPFVFNACEWGNNQPWTWGAEAGSSMWRATQDAREDWIGTHQFPGVLGGTDEVRDLWMWAGVNRFNDLDMMCIGLHGKGSPSNHTATWGRDGGQLPEASQLKGEKARTQMSLWCMLASPLSISCDVRTTPSNPCNSSAGVDELKGEDLEILTNKAIISISQDALGQQAEYMPNLGTNSADFSTSGMDVYVKDLTEGRKALAVVNRNATGTATGKTIQFADIYLDGTKTYTVEDVWAGTSEELVGSVTTGTLAAAQTKVYILTEKKQTVAVEQVVKAQSKAVAYDLQGRRVKANAKGLTIRKGAKELR